MSGELWISLVSSILVPVITRLVVAYWPPAKGVPGKERA